MFLLIIIFVSKLNLFDIEASVYPRLENMDYFEFSNEPYQTPDSIDKLNNLTTEELNELYTAGLCSPEYYKNKLKESSTVFFLSIYGV